MLFRSSREVRRKQLKELGIDLTDENLDLHNKLSTLHSNLGRTNLKRILTWKEKLLEANQKEELYHQSSLKEVINDRIRRKSALLVLFYLKNLEIKLLMNTVLEMVKSDKGWLLWLCYQVFKNPVESAKRFWNPV